MNGAFHSAPCRFRYVCTPVALLEVDINHILPSPATHMLERMSVAESPVSPSLGKSPLCKFKNEQETIEYQDDDWHNDSQNPKNWTSAQKWTVVSIVRRFLPSYVSELTSGISFTLGIHVYFCRPVVQLHDGTGPAGYSGDISYHQ